MKITCVMWNAYVPMMQHAATEAGVDLSIFPNRLLDESPDMLREVVEDMESAKAILVYRTSHAFWDILEPDIRRIGKTVPVISVGYDPAHWALSTVRQEIAATTYAYLTYNGKDNLTNLLLYIKQEITGSGRDPGPPRPVPWQGVYHPDSPASFESVGQYLSWYRSRESPWVGLLISRVAWVSGSLSIEDELIRNLEAEGLNVIPVFTYSIRDDNLGAKGMAEVVTEFFTSGGKPRVLAIVKLVSFMLGATKGSDNGIIHEAGPALLKKLNIPVFQPVITYYKSLEDWRSSAGLSEDTGWCIAMPEFEGVIEPVMAGANSLAGAGDCSRVPEPERCRKITRRIARWVRLAGTPVNERKVVFLLNNNPCAGVEANVGSAAHLDSLESVARILNRMKEAGYSVNPPRDGAELIRIIMERRAFSEFRWTSATDIVAKGGILAMMDTRDYLPYFSILPEEARARIQEVWGDPPGGAMVLGEKMLITGINFGNALVCVQPKRGCYGARCDGQVCRILHDPACPPPHQYLATYHYLESVFGAHVVVHVGTHGNLEFLPGKALALSSECFPDIAVGTVPHLYIYNADNPPEGTIAKRRSYATLIDHMQTAMTGSGLPDELENLETLLREFETAQHDSAHAHALHHFIRDAIAAANLDRDLHISHDTPLEEVVRRAHEALSRIRNTQIPSGMHIFGQVPDGEKRVDFISAILRFSHGEQSPRSILAAVMGFDLALLLARQDSFSQSQGLSNGELLAGIDERMKDLIRAVLAGKPLRYDLIFGRGINHDSEDALKAVVSRVLDIDRRITASLETDALFNGFSGGHVPAGPAGLITRGHDDVLPTGRNFFSLDPFRIPTRASWRVGERLAEEMIRKFKEDEGVLPETVAFYWMASDIMSADGEMLAEMFALMGVRPVWQQNGQVRSFEIIPAGQLNHPRIDITVRMSGIIRDNFTQNVELLDRAVQVVAACDEPPEVNFVRKHALARIGERGGEWREATLRLFGSKPGTYATGVNLAVLSSAWKEESDLAEIFIAWNGYAYGDGVTGRDSHEQFADNLSKVSLTFNKVASDEYDLLGCCCYFGNHGGLTAAARHLSGKEVRSYYGDTREPTHVEVRELADEIRRVVRTKLLNPKWIAGMKEHGYKGAADIMKRVTRVYGWEASTQEVDDWIFDDIAEAFVLDPEMKQFFEENNPHALEEIARRLLEAERRGLWDARPEILDALKNSYLEIESWMEDRAGNGDCQGGSVDIYTHRDVGAWGGSVADILRFMHARRRE